MFRTLRARLGSRLAVPTTVLMVAVPAMVVVPTVDVPAALAGALGTPSTPHSVAGSVHRLVIGRVDAETRRSYARTGAAAPVALTGTTDTARFDLVALTWTGTLPAGTTLSVRLRESGRWSGWYPMAPAVDGPDRASGKEAPGPGATEPLLTNGADGVQARADNPGGRAPSGLTAVLVDGGRSGADSPPSVASAEAATPMPHVITRAEWGADESLVKTTPVIDQTVRTFYVHHTDTTNSYTADQAYAQVRSVYVFHTKVRGWNDIGYNFVVDRFGRAFEGRRGSITQAVHGAHTGGFNTDSMGISLLGTYTSTRPTSAALRGLVDVIAWKAAQYFVNPRGWSRPTATAGSDKFAEGTAVNMRTISGHRDAYSTDCPGAQVYPSLPWIRGAVALRMTPGLVAPQVSTTAPQWSGSAVTVTASVPTTQRWWLTATPMCSSGAIATSSGTTSSRVSATWDLRDGSGAPAAPGVYRLSLVSSSPVGSVRYDRDVEVLPTPQAPDAACRVARRATGDAVTSAVTLGRSRFPGAQTVVLAGVGAPMDGLLAGPLATAKQAPLLLTQAAALPQVVADDIAARGVRTAYLVGGRSAISTAVETRLRALGVSTLVRLAGSDRYGTASLVARQVGAPNGAAIAVSSGSLSDLAIAAGAASATARPILLLSPAGVPGMTGSTIKALKISNVAVVGPASHVSAATMSRLAGYGVTSRIRLAGADGGAASTAVAVARGYARPIPNDSLSLVGWSGWAWWVVAAGQGRPVLVTGSDAVPPVTASWLATRNPDRVAVVSDLRGAGTPVLRGANAQLR